MSGGLHGDYRLINAVRDVLGLEPIPFALLVEVKISATSVSFILMQMGLYSEHFARGHAEFCGVRFSEHLFEKIQHPCASAYWQLRDNGEAKEAVARKKMSPLQRPRLLVVDWQLSALDHKTLTDHKIIVARLGAKFERFLAGCGGEGTPLEL